MSLRDTLKVHWPLWLTLAFGVGVWLFWWQGYPEALCYQEQNQLFLWSWDYFVHDMSVAGGLADWLSELIVQFYYLPWLGALLLGCFFALFLWTAYRALATLYKDNNKEWIPFLAALMVVLGMFARMGDIEVLLSLPVAVSLSMSALWAMNKWGRRWWADLIAAPLLFWLIGGGAAWLYVVLRCAGFLFSAPRRWLSLTSLLWLLVVQLGAYRTVLVQYPLESVLTGINYHRVPSISRPPEEKPLWTWTYDSDLYALLRLNALVRNEEWDDVIRSAEEHPVGTGFESNCVNLALGKTRQLADRMFSFYQSGNDALIAKHQANNMIDYPSMEAFWHLGLVNACLRYASDLQESILNARKSGRLTKRIAQCQIVNRQYKQARKNLDLLKQTLFYRSWALEKEQLLGHEAAINGDPELGRVRQLRFMNDFLFSYDEKDKIFGLLFINNTNNKLALDYFMAQMLLDGNIQGFMQYMSWVQQYGGYTAMPLGYQDAVKCIQAHGNLPGSAYAEYVKRMMGK